MDPKKLPVYELRTELTEVLRNGNRLILEAPTGSGKSTQVPQMVLDGGTAGPGEIVVLQPRRLAARMLATRVAFERGVSLGDEIGYQVRMDCRTSAKTQIRYVTEGVLLRQFLSDPQLRGISTIIFDEFHERHIYGDITLARALCLQEVRPELKIVVMSATLEAGPLRDYLSPCRELKSEGRTFPVEIGYAPKRIDFRKQPVWDAAADAFEQAVTSGAEGDFLVFMPGAYEIKRTVEAIRSKRASREFSVLPLHGELAVGEQDRAVGQCERRKVVVATNVAETSITIDGIRVVIDSGLARMARYDPNRGIDTLLVERISRASADQRAGRAGRTAPGFCYRLWMEQEHVSRPLQTLPEILRHDLAEVVLTLKAGGIEDVEGFAWLEPPDSQSLERTLTLLTDLGALSRSGSLTEVGRKMAAFPMHPRYARMLLAGEEFGCVREACLIAALSQGRSVLVRNAGKTVQQDREELFGDEVSDFKRLMRVWGKVDQTGYQPEVCRKLGVHGGAARQVKLLFERFVRLAKQEGLRVNADLAEDDEALQKCILRSFSDQVAKRRDCGTLLCEIVHDRSGELARESVVRDHMLLVAAEILEIEGGRNRNVRLNLCTAIKEAWLQQLFPEDMQVHEEVVYDTQAKRVVTKRSQRFRDLDLQISMVQEADPQLAAELIAEEVLAGRLELHKWNDQVEAWIARVNTLAEGCPDIGVSAIDDEARTLMVQEICWGAVCRRDLKDRAVWPVVKAWLTPSQREMLDKQVPERIRLPSGLNARIRYEPGQPPVLAATIQKLYDLNETPKIGFGRIPVLIEALAPNQRPQQKTQDMASFWATSYPLIRKELKGRYPKHEWR